MTKMLPRSLFPVVALGLILAACATPVPVTPPPVVATLPPPPPTMPVGGYPKMQIAEKRVDGRYVTPNIDMTPAAAVWHLRGALNVAALACGQAGGGTVDPYNAWLGAHRAVLDANVKQYVKEWQTTGWSDWRAAYDNAQTRLYNFYSQPALRTTFCGVARQELTAIAAVPDAQLPTFARESLARLDQPFIDFFTAFDAWRDYYHPEVAPPPVVATIPVESQPAMTPSLDVPAQAVAPEVSSLQP